MSGRSITLTHEGKSFDVTEQKDGKYTVTYNSMMLKTNVNGVALAADIARKFIDNYEKETPEKAAKK
jgi:hypothetical protein